MSLYLDIGQGAGLSSATGVQPFLPTLLVGALARGDLGVDFDGTDWRFLESPGFLLAVFALALVWYGAERSLLNRAGGVTSAADERERPSAVTPAGRRRVLDLAKIAVGVILGALLFAGSLADGGNEAWPGLPAGVACALLAWVAVGGFLDRARRRLESEGGLLTVYADGGALALAGLSIAAPPVAFVALAAFVLLLVRGRREEGRKYAGLRILR